MANPTKKASPSRIAAIKFIDAANEAGFYILILSSSVVRISKKFVPGDNQAYVECDMTAFGVLEMAPLKGGSVWGTDGGSIGGQVGLQNGHYTLNKSGNGVRFMNELKKILENNHVN